MLKSRFEDSPPTSAFNITPPLPTAGDDPSLLVQMACAAKSMQQPLVAQAPLGLLPPPRVHSCVGDAIALNITASWFTHFLP